MWYQTKRVSLSFLLLAWGFSSAYGASTSISQPKTKGGLASRSGGTEIGDEEICECVPYYQCDEDRRIKTDGEDILDPRMPTCADVDVCCFPPKEETGEGGGVHPGGSTGGGPGGLPQPGSPGGGSGFPPGSGGGSSGIGGGGGGSGFPPSSGGGLGGGGGGSGGGLGGGGGGSPVPLRPTTAPIPPSGGGSIEEGPKCECVPFYQCDEDRQFKEDGAGNLDPRFSCPGEIEICCFPPLTEIEEGGGGFPGQGGEGGSQTGPGGEGGTQTGPGVPPYGPETGQGGTQTGPGVPPYGPGEGGQGGGSGVDGGETQPPYGPGGGGNQEPTPGPIYNNVPKPRPSNPGGKGGCGRKRLTEDVDFGNSYRITGPEGSPVPTGFGEFPWMVALFRDDELICGGSLIHPSVIMTAAHCLNKAEGGKLTLRAGEWDLAQSKEPIPHQDRWVSRVIPHPHYNPKNLHNDIALILTDKPFQLTDSVDVICFDKPKAALGKDCLATGWGKTGYGPEAVLPTILKQVDLPIIDNGVCQEKLRKTRLGKYFRLHKSFICAGGIPDHDTCTGDGGGPLVCPTQDGSYTQAGIVAWGIGCGNENPAVYVSVHHFADWIHEQMKQM